MGGATKRVLRMYPLMYTFLGASLGALLTLLLLADYAPDVLEPPDGKDSIPRYEWLLPLLLVLLGPMAAPLLLDLMNIPGSKVPEKGSPESIDPTLNNADSSDKHRATCSSNTESATSRTTDPALSSVDSFDRHLAAASKPPATYAAHKWLANAETQC